MIAQGLGAVALPTELYGSKLSNLKELQKVIQKITYRLLMMPYIAYRLVPVNAFFNFFK